MFRNQKIQRAIAALVLLTFNTATLAQTIAMAAAAVPLSVTDVGPLKRRDFAGQRNSALLPLDTQPMPPGKG